MESLVARSWVWVAGLVLACALTACGDDDQDGSRGTAGADAGHAPSGPPTSGTGAGAGGAGGTQNAADAAVPFMPGVRVCALQVGVECDGPEDCGSGSACCAQFSRTTYSYSSVECRQSCTGIDQYALCHPGYECADPDQVCRRSVLVPHDFITVCAPRALVPAETTSVRTDGEIACGDVRCEAGTEHCCLRSTFDFGTMMSTPLAPFCAPAGSECLCGVEPTLDLDAGQEDGG